MIKLTDILFEGKLSKSEIKKMRDKFDKTGKLPPHLQKLADLMKKDTKVKDIVVPGLEWMAEEKLIEAKNLKDLHNSTANKFASWKSDVLILSKKLSGSDKKKVHKDINTLNKLVYNISQIFEKNLDEGKLTEGKWKSKGKYLSMPSGEESSIPGKNDRDAIIVQIKNDMFSIITGANGKPYAYGPSYDKSFKTVNDLTNWLNKSKAKYQGIDNR